jgi:hypothetical protein
MAQVGRWGKAQMRGMSTPEHPRMLSHVSTDHEKGQTTQVFFLYSFLTQFHIVLYLRINLKQNGA